LLLRGCAPAVDWRAPLTGSPLRLSALPGAAIKVDWKQPAASVTTAALTLPAVLLPSIEARPRGPQATRAGSRRFKLRKLALELTKLVGQTVDLDPERLGEAWVGSSRALDEAERPRGADRCREESLGERAAAGPEGG
jgi:hypothetical protein